MTTYTGYACVRIDNDEFSGWYDGGSVGRHRSKADQRRIRCSSRPYGAVDSQRHTSVFGTHRSGGNFIAAVDLTTPAWTYAVGDIPIANTSNLDADSGDADLMRGALNT